MNKRMIAAAVLGSVLTGMTARGADEAMPATQPDAGQIGNTARIQVTGPLAGKTEKVAWMGVATSRAPSALLEQLKIKSGLVVDDVKAGSPAEAAGLKPQDIVLKMDDQILLNPAQLEKLVRLHNPGDSITLSLLREGNSTTATAKLVEHDVLVMQDVDPQALAGAVMSLPGGQARVTYAHGDGNADGGANGGGNGGGNGGPNNVVVMPGNGNGEMHVTTMSGGSKTTRDGNGETTFESTFSDGTHQLTMVRKETEHVLTIKDNDGKQLF